MGNREIEREQSYIPIKCNASNLSADCRDQAYLKYIALLQGKKEEKKHWQIQYRTVGSAKKRQKQFNFMYFRAAQELCQVLMKKTSLIFPILSKLFYTQFQKYKSNKFQDFCCIKVVLGHFNPRNLLLGGRKKTTRLQHWKS